MKKGFRLSGIDQHLQIMHSSDQEVVPTIITVVVVFNNEKNKKV